MRYHDYNGTKVRLQREEYMNGSLAVALYTEDGELYNVITTNLNDSIQSDSMAFLDENNHRGIGNWLVDNCLAYPMAYQRQSGFCSYQLYTFFTKSF